MLKKHEMLERRNRGVMSRFNEIITGAVIPSTIYHYTTSLGLLGILGSGEIWTTKIHYLNDTSELTLGLKYIEDEINSQLEDKNRTRSIEELKELRDVQSGLYGVNVSVASFTEKGDQLSQWRGYSKVGDAYSLGFDGNKLNDYILGKDGFYFIPCIYNEEDHRLLAKELVDYGKVVGHSQTRSAVASPFQLMQFNEAVLLVASMIKSRKFKEEKEWRLGTRLMEYKNAEFRQGSFSLVPYWKCSLPLLELLQKIIIGPTPEYQLSHDAVEGLLRKKYPEDFSKIEVSGSKIPYRTI